MSEPLFVLRGRVKHGKQLGSRLGFPTANIDYERDGRLWPQDGVYVAIAQIEQEERRYLAILNQGRHPTAPEGAPTVEAHLLGYPNQALYDRRLTLAYRQFLRPEQTFPALTELSAQLERDRASALTWAREHAPELSGADAPCSPATVKE